MIVDPGVGHQSSPVFARRIRVFATEEEGLHVHLLDTKFTRRYLVVTPLVVRVETARMTAQCDKTRVLLLRDNDVGINLVQYQICN